MPLNDDKRRELAADALYRVVGPAVDDLQVALKALDARSAVIEEALLSLGAVLDHEDVEAVTELVDTAVVQVLVGWVEDEDEAREARLDELAAVAEVKHAKTLAALDDEEDW